jgi:phenylacetate-CoA ligase
MIYNASAECMDRKALERLQMERLQQTVKHVYENVPLYKERFDAKGITPGDIKTLEDLELLPFTVKDDLRRTHPFPDNFKTTSANSGSGSPPKAL